MNSGIDTPVTLGILAATILVSVLAFRDRVLLDRLMFVPREILAGKQYERLLTSGFIHADWLHLAFNAITLLYCNGYQVQLKRTATARLPARGTTATDPQRAREAMHRSAHVARRTSHVARTFAQPGPRHTVIVYRACERQAPGLR